MKQSIWVGFDPREADAFAVTRHSINKHLITPIPVRGDEVRVLPCAPAAPAIRPHRPYLHGPMLAQEAEHLLQQMRLAHAGRAQQREPARRATLQRRAAKGPRRVENRV